MLWRYSAVLPFLIVSLTGVARAQNTAPDAVQQATETSGTSTENAPAPQPVGTISVPVKLQFCQRMHSQNGVQLTGCGSLAGPMAATRGPQAEVASWLSNRA
jgi:hypothetical protein